MKVVAIHCSFQNLFELCSKVLHIHGQTFAVMGSHWCSWVVGFVVDRLRCGSLFGGCLQRCRCVVVVVVDQRKDRCHML